MKYSCVLLQSDRAHLADAAESYARNLFEVRHAGHYARSAIALDPEVHTCLDRGDVDYLFNFLSPVIVSPELLARVGRAAVNFHPASPAWPGVGSASYALYEGDSHFGATAHLMAEKVDAGPIIKTVRFPILERDTCETLFNRALDYSLVLYYEVLAEIARTGQIHFSGETWKRRALSRASFEKWMTLSGCESESEIMRKERALRHSRFPGPFIEVCGLRFELPPRGSPA